MVLDSAARNKVVGMTKTEAVYQELRRRILTGILAPGSAVDQEWLAADMGISTTPVREALRRLEAGGWISLAAHREARIAPLSSVELEELYGVRLSLDPMAAELAVGRIDAGKRAYLRELLNEPATGDMALRLARNRELHSTIYRACGNQTLIDILDQLWDRSDRYRLVLLRESPVIGHTSDHEHASIVDAIEAGDKRLVAKLSRDHLRGSMKTLQPMLDQRDKL